MDQQREQHEEQHVARGMRMPRGVRINRAEIRVIPFNLNRNVGYGDEDIPEPPPKCC